MSVVQDTSSSVPEAVAKHANHVTLPFIGKVHVPPSERIAFYAGMGALVAVGIIELPIALVLGAGHILADQHWSNFARGLGKAFEEC